MAGDRAVSELFVQLLGLVAIAFGVLSIQLPKRHQILLFLMSSSALWVIHFALLGALTGAIMNIIGVIRAATFYRWNSEPRPLLVLLGVYALIIAGGIITWEGYPSLLPVMGFMVATFGLWQRDEQRIRWFMIGAAPFWFLYNVISGSYAGAINEALAVVSSAIALRRYGK